MMMKYPLDITETDKSLIVRDNDMLETFKTCKEIGAIGQVR